MVIVAGVVAYSLGAVVAAALQHELEAKPKAKTAVIPLCPLVPAALIGLAAGLL